MRYDELSPLSRADERFLVQTAYPKIDRMSQRDADGPSISRYDGKFNHSHTIGCDVSLSGPARSTPQVGQPMGARRARR